MCAQQRRSQACQAASLWGFFYQRSDFTGWMVEEKYDCVFVCVVVFLFICKSLLQVTDV